VKHQRVKVSLGADGSATDALGGAGAVAAGVQRMTLASDDPAVVALQVLDNIVSGSEAQVDIVAALPAGTNNIGDVDVLTVPADPFGANADAASATGSISAKLRYIASTGIPITGTVTVGSHAVTNAGTFAVQAVAAGAAAENAAVSGNPVLTGGRYDSSPRTLGNGDVGAVALNASGQMLVEIAAGAGSGGTAAADDADFTAGTTSATPVMGVYEASPTSVTNGDMGVVGLTQTRAMRVAIDSGGITGQVDDAAMTLGTKEGIPIVGSYSATRDLLDTGDGGIVALTSRRSQYVTGDGVVSTANSSTANLAGAAAFTGTSEEVTDYAQIHISVFSSHASATDGLSLQQSSDATNWDILDTFTIAATTAKIITLQPAARYFRLVYTNGATLTTSLRIQTIFKSIAAKGSSQRPADATSNENDFEMVSGFLHGFNGTTWDRLRSVNTGYLGVTPHFAGTVSATNTGAASAQTQRVVTATDSTIGTVTAVTTVATVTNITNQGHGADDAAFTPATTRVMVAGYFADETATDSVDEGDMGAARITLDRKQIITQYAHAAGGHSAFKSLDLDETEEEVKASAGCLFWIHCMNMSASVRYLKIYANTAAGTTVGTTTPVLTFPIPTLATTNGSGFVLHFGDVGLQLATGITVAATTGLADNDTGAPGAGEVVFNCGFI
jgi:hypothetical protein